MSLHLLKNLNGSHSGGLKKFIEEFEGKGEPRICWYPSAGEDFRALLYLHPKFSDFSPSLKLDPLPPDIFLFTDYFPWQHSTFLDNRNIYNDFRTDIWVENIEELPSLHTSLDNKILHFPDGSSATNKLLFLTVRVNSDKLGEFIVPVIYAFTENESFCAQKLLPNKALLSHIIHIRYGGGCGGGGNASGIWIKNVLKRLGCELFISDGHFYWQSGDKHAIKHYPILATNNVEPKFQIIRTIKSKRWSGHGDVTWNLIDCDN